jgi:cytochrome c553
MKLEPGLKQTTQGMLRLLGAAAAAVLTALVGCRSTDPGEAAPEKGAAQLWAQTCMQCHNNRSPDSYSDAEWDVAMQHMRLRANLTPEEQRRIVEFLKSAN